MQLQVKRGVERLCDAQAEEVLASCKRPLVRLSGDDWEGDIHTKVSHSVAKQMQLPVAQVALRLRDEIRKETEAVSTCVVTNNGYVNISLRDAFVRGAMRAMLSDESRRLNVPRMSSERVVVDYFGPNVGKELHMGHLRSAAIGAAVANILEFCGAKVFRRNHVGDFGAHAGQIMRYLVEYDPTSLDAFSEAHVDRERALESARQQRGYSVWAPKGIHTSNRMAQPTPETGVALIVNTIGEIYRCAKRKCAEEEGFMGRCKEETAELQRGRNRHQKVWRHIATTSMRGHRDILENFKLDKVRDVPESCYAKRVFALVERLVSEGHAARRPDGSVTIVVGDDATTADDVEGGGDGASRQENELVLITKEGSATYLAVDLTALEHRLREHMADKVLYVTDAAQRAHFDKLERVARQVGILQGQQVEHLGYGAVRADDGKKMRSRTGAGVAVADVWEETLERCTHEVEKKGEFSGAVSAFMARKLAAGSILYSDLSTAHKDPYTFTASRLLNQGGNNLVSVMYAYVRGRSILRRLAQSGGDRVGEGVEVPEDGPFRDDRSRRLAVRLVGLENAILSAASARAPHRLCKYLWALARDFTRFYEGTRVLEAGGASAESVQMVDLFAKAVHLLLSLLNVETLERL
ncbi:arginyl-tRNA synthetase [Babesia caballi]|uniref:arginine--tRNA ligase n=1 Tax=Babesia caballi TaxID=5871 RepID=A0AAV4M0K2_BABCB|nr:arginyl-tRNA synthetase [Babesia caballi]